MALQAVSGVCPQCGGSALKTYAVPRASVDDVLAKEYFAASGETANKDSVAQGVCSRCGCRWIPRTRQERRLRALSGQLGREAKLAALAEDAASAPRAGSAGAGRKRRPVVWLLVAVIVVELILTILT